MLVSTAEGLTGFAFLNSVKERLTTSVTHFPASSMAAVVDMGLLGGRYTELIHRR